MFRLAALVRLAAKGGADCTRQADAPAMMPMLLHISTSSNQRSHQHSLKFGSRCCSQSRLNRLAAKQTTRYTGYSAQQSAPGRTALKARKVWSRPTACGREKATSACVVGALASFTYAHSAMSQHQRFGPPAQGMRNHELVHYHRPACVRRGVSTARASYCRHHNCT